MVFNKKELTFLKDLQKEEKLCADKYTKAASCAADPALQDMLTEIAGHEQQHHDTITQMMAGTIPTPQPKPMPKPKKGAANQTGAPKSTASRQGKMEDAYLVKDLLATEKYVSGAYNTAVFEFVDENARHALSDIQQEEQHHGKQLYDYLSANNMYN